MSLSDSLILFDLSGRPNHFLACPSRASRIDLPNLRTKSSMSSIPIRRPILSPRRLACVMPLRMYSLPVTASCALRRPG